MYTGCSNSRRMINVLSDFCGEIDVDIPTKVLRIDLRIVEFTWGIILALAWEVPVPLINVNMFTEDRTIVAFTPSGVSVPVLYTKNLSFRLTIDVLEGAVVGLQVALVLTY